MQQKSFYKSKELYNRIASPIRYVRVQTSSNPDGCWFKIKEEQESRFKITRTSWCLNLLVNHHPTGHCFCFLGQFNNYYDTSHWKAAKRVLQYLKGTADIGLTYGLDPGLVKGFVDADWGNCVEDRKSYTGYLYSLNGCPISWDSRKQRTVALSTTEGEYMAMPECAKEAIYLKRLILELGFEELANVTLLFYLGKEISKKKLKKIKARRQFKALVRLVIANLYWLSAELHIKTKQISLKQKRTGRFLLTTNERRILKTAPEYRDEEDITLLTKTIGHLKCFKKYPEDVKRSLIAHTYYEYFPPNRVLVRQHAPPWAMYFIIAGQLEIVVSKYIDELDEHAVSPKQYFTVGDTFGDSALLHDTPRMATVITTTHCELLILYKFYFDTILRSLTLTRWQEIRSAIEKIPFFENSTNFFLTEMCVMAQIARYRRNEIILGDGIGKTMMVHFIISGKCSLIEHIPIRNEYTAEGRKSVYVSVEEENKILQLQRKREPSQRKFSKQTSASINALSSKTKSSENSQILEHLTKKSVISLGRRLSQDKEDSSETVISDNIPVYYPEDVDVRYIEICTYNPKSVFGVGENFRRRRVVASTAVTCLLVPNYWLLPQSNNWNLIRDHLNKILPDSTEVYKMYLQDRKFKKFKDAYIQKLVEKSPKCNTIHNVPYSIRIKEDFAFRFNNNK